MIGDENSKEIVYLQSQDGNIYRSPPRPDSQPQLGKLQEFIEPEVKWMEEALGQPLLARSCDVETDDQGTGLKLSISG